MGSLRGYSCLVPSSVSKTTLIAGASSKGAVTSTNKSSFACVWTATVQPPLSRSSSNPCVPCYWIRRWSTSSTMVRKWVSGALLRLPKKTEMRPCAPTYSCFTPTCSKEFSKRTPEGDVQRFENAFRMAGMTSFGIPTTTGESFTGAGLCAAAAK